MNGRLLAEDIKSILISKRATYSIIIMAVLALSIAIVLRLAPEGLRNAIELSAPSSSGVFEYLWTEDILDKLLLLVFISFGSYAICDIEDERMTGLLLSKPQKRSEFLAHRLIVSLVSMILVFIAGILISGAIGSLIVGEMDLALFLLHQILVLPMILFVFSLTFFLSVPLRTTTPTVILSFAISLALSFLYSFLLMTGDPEPSMFNPLALGYRILMNIPIDGAAIIALSSSFMMLLCGSIWFLRKDL